MHGRDGRDDYTGRVVRITDPSLYRFTYDTAGRLYREISPQFGIIAATLDKNSNVTRLNWQTGSGNIYTSYVYDALDRQTRVNEGYGASAIRIFQQNYNPLSQRTSNYYGPTTGAVASGVREHTPTGQPTRVRHNWNGSTVTFLYTYNQDQQRTTFFANDNTFLPSGLAAGSTSYTSNALNQYTSVNSQAYTYDARGNLTSDGVWTYGYDTENRLISATKSGVTATYAYDQLGRRLSKTVNGVTTAWASFGNQEIAELEGPSGGPLDLTRRFVYGPGLDEPVASFDAAGVRTYYFSDAQGSVVALANDTGQVTEKYAYTAYGIEKVAGPGTAAYRYTGRRYDAETGLYHYRARAYSPRLGRFLQTDPIGTAGGINLYAYVGNDPVNAVDPFGLAKAPALGPSAPLASAPPASSPGPVVSDASPYPIYGGQQYAAEIPRYLQRQLGIENGRVPGEAVGGGGGGRLGGPAHRATVDERAGQLEAQGYTITGGGGRLPERSVITPEGNRRFPDISARDPAGNSYFENIGRSTNSGAPIARERRALDDIGRATGTRPGYTPYD